MRMSAIICGMINPKIFCGAIPTNVSVKLRANVTGRIAGTKKENIVEFHTKIIRDDNEVIMTLLPQPQMAF